MRKFIIDTDTGSDDASALLLAALSPDIDILGVTTLSGNIPLHLATLNALQTLEICGADIPVYPGAAVPLFRPPVTAVGVHGNDGMGDRGLIHPQTQPQAKHAVDFILETVRAYPGEVEIVALGPATNLALAILKDRDTMKQVRHIWSMGTAGFGRGNCGPVAEFNVYVDAESYSILLNSGIPLTIIGFDLCLGPAALHKNDLEEMANGTAVSRFACECTSALLQHNLRLKNEYSVDLPDAVAMGVALWPDLTIDSVQAYCYCCTKEEPSYGQVILYDSAEEHAVSFPVPPANAEVIRTIRPELFKERYKSLLLSAR